MLEITFRGEVVRLLPQRALYRPDHGALYIADPHWGKTAAFRAAYIPLPDADIHDDLHRLTTALSATGARRLVILGDLTHSRHSFQPPIVEAVASWRASHPALQIDLVVGNHDPASGALPTSWGITVLPHLHDDAGFLLSHAPVPDASGFVLCGHLHPSWTLRGRGRQQITLPAFIQTAHMLVFPAFSRFTGATEYRFDALEQIYVVTDQQVIRVRV